MLLAARGLSYARPAEAGAVTVFSGLDLELEAGSLVDVCGPSGSGKTTLLLALARLLPDTSADALELEGIPAASWRPEEWRAAVALMPQKSTLAPGTVRDNLLLPWTLRVRAHSDQPGDAAMRAALDSVGLDDVELDRQATRLSAGQASRVVLLRIVATAPKAMLLDEPDAALDDDSAGLVGTLVRSFVAEGGAVVRVRHLRVDAAADRRLRLEDGRLAEVSS
jgi:putative ABC transport system ATP-binding protein